MSQQEFEIIVDAQGHGRRVRKVRRLEMKKTSIETVVNAAVREGRIENDQRDFFVRFFESEPESATVVLAMSLPNAERAARNGAPSDAAQRSAIYALTGIPVEKVL